MSDEHEAFIKTPKQLIAVIVLSFVVPIALIAMLVKFVGFTDRQGAGADALTPDAITARIRPVANFELVDASAPKQAASGESVYTAQCAACHAAGVAGAPKFGDAAAWAPRIATGYEALLGSVVKGKGAMPAQAGGKFNDHELGLAIVHMANAAGGSMAAPEAPAAGGAKTAAATPAAAAPAAAAPAAAAPAAAAPAAAAAAAPAAPAPAAPVAAVAAVAAAVQAAPSAPAASADLAAGKQLYDSSCMACHASGVANAPKFGDKAAWGERAAKGVDELAKSVIAGKGAMPPRGASAGTDQQIHHAVAYMLSALK